MRLLHKYFKFSFEFRENERNILIIENPKIFSEFIKELYQPDGIGEPRIVLSENETPLTLGEHLCCIVNPLGVSLNEKKLLSKLHEKLKKEIMSSELLLETNKVLAALEEYALQIVQSMDFELTYSDKMDVQDILKLLNIHFDDKQETLLERIVSYIEIMYQLIGIRCFVFVHLLSYLTEYEMEKLYEYFQYQKLYILLVECNQPKDISKFSNVVIIDKDTCEIVL